MTTSPCVPTSKVEPPQVNEQCDHSQCPAPALVAIQVTSGRLVFCGHHYDELPIEVRSNLTSTFDARA